MTEATNSREKAFRVLPASVEARSDCGDGTCGCGCGLPLGKDGICCSCGCGQALEHR